MDAGSFKHGLRVMSCMLGFICPALPWVDGISLFTLSDTSRSLKLLGYSQDAVILMWVLIVGSIITWKSSIGGLAQAYPCMVIIGMYPSGFGLGFYFAALAAGLSLLTAAPIRVKAKSYSKPVIVLEEWK